LILFFIEKIKIYVIVAAPQGKVNQQGTRPDTGAGDDDARQCDDLIRILGIKNKHYHDGYTRYGCSVFLRLVYLAAWRMRHYRRFPAP
jgi:hypothetical protein